MTEKKIIEILYQYAQTNKAFPITHDDTAYLPRLASECNLISTDQLVENIHFKWQWCTPADVAHKLLQVNISDIIVKGGIPVFALCNLYISPSFMKTKNNYHSFAKTLGAELQKYGIQLIGGDTTTSNQDAFSLTILGQTDRFIPRQHPSVTKKDAIYLLGNVGGSSYALSQLNNNTKLNKLIKDAYTRPQAKVDFTSLCKQKMIKASIDLSDSLHESLQILSKDNQRDLSIQIDSLPIPAYLEQLPFSEQIKHTLCGGEDLAILFITEEGEMGSSHLPIQRIGTVLDKNKKPQVTYYNDNKQISSDIFARYIFSHFK